MKPCHRFFCLKVLSNELVFRNRRSNKTEGMRYGAICAGWQLTFNNPESKLKDCLSLVTSKWNGHRGRKREREGERELKMASSVFVSLF